MSEPPFMQAQNVLSTFGIRAQAGTSVVAFALGGEGGGQLTPTFGDEVSTLTDERIATLTKLSGGAPRVETRKRYLFPFAFRVRSMVSVATGTAGGLVSIADGMIRVPNAAFKTVSHLVRGSSKRAAEPAKKELVRIGKALKRPVSRFAIPFVVECEVITISYQRGGDRHHESDLRIRIAPYNQGSVRFRNYFCEKATFALKGSAAVGRNGRPHCDIEWSFYADGKRLRTMATEHQGSLRVAYDGDWTCTVAGADAGLIEALTPPEPEDLPVDAPAGRSLTSKPLRKAIRGAGMSSERPGPGKWKPDRATVREALRRHVADRYALPLADAPAQARVNEVFSVQSPARWLLFLAHQTGELYRTKSLVRDNLAGSGVYRSDEQAAALAEELKKLLDDAFESFTAARHTAAGQPLSRTARQAEVERIATSYDQQIQLLHLRYNRSDDVEKQLLVHQLTDTAYSGLVAVIRAHRGLTGLEQAKRAADRYMPDLTELGRFAHYLDHQIPNGSTLHGTEPYSLQF